MARQTTLAPRPDARPDESDRQGTREKLLETAGLIFAEKGPQGATGREICEAAGANAAAINYHFGGMDGLYAAVLEAGRDRIVATADLAAAVSSAAAPEDKLRAVVRLVARGLLRTDRSSWALRLLTREVMAPSPVGAGVLLATAQARLGVLKALLAAILELPTDHPAVSRCCVSITAPLQLLLLADRAVLKRVYPELDFSADGVEALADHFVRFAMAGLAASAAAAREEGARGAP